METLAVMLGCLGVCAVGMIARSVLVALVLTLTAAPLVAIVTGMRAAYARRNRSGGWASVHGLRCKAA